MFELRLLCPEDRVETLMADSRYSFMFSGMFISDNMSKILSRILRIPVAGKPITIVDLSGVPSEIVEVLVSMVSRMIFDFALWSERSKAVPVLLVCEEAGATVVDVDGHELALADASVRRQLLAAGTPELLAALFEASA